jgi:hypothetical protein
MQKKLLGIISILDFEVTGQLLIIYAAFIKYLSKNGNTMWQCISCIDFKNAYYDSVRREVCYNVLITFDTL